MEQSVAIYHIVKIKDNKTMKKVQAEAKIADMYIRDVETKFEFLLFNENYKGTYVDIFLYFRSEWERICKALAQKNFRYIRINKNHFDNLYAPQV